MHSIASITGSWFKYFQKSKPAPKIAGDGFAQPKHISRLLKRSYGTEKDDGSKIKNTADTHTNVSDQWVQIQKPLASQIVHDAELANTMRELRQTDESYQVSDFADLHANDSLRAGLQMLQSTTEQVLSLIFELNAARVPAIKQVTESVRELQDIVGRLPQHTTPEDTSGAETQTFDELHHRVETLMKGPLASLQADQARRTDLEDEVVLLLFQSETYLRRLLETNAAEWPRLPEPDPITISASNEDVILHSAIDARYLSQVGDVDSIRERLTDLRDERFRLLEEQDSRAQVGLSLDEDSLKFLESFDDEDERLLDSLEYAELQLDALRRLIHDEDARQIANEALENEHDEDASALHRWDVTFLPDDMYDDLTKEPIHNQLNRRIEALRIRFSNYFRDQHPTPVNNVDYINIWLLLRLQHLPQLLTLFTSFTEKNYQQIQPKDLLKFFLDQWFNDTSTVEYTKNRIFADQQSMQASGGESQNVEHFSLSARSLPPSALPLMKTGPLTTTQDLITNAMQTRAMRSSQASVG